ncbi:MAG: hypothetical protein ABIH37_00970 [archaeon]
MSHLEHAARVCSGDCLSSRDVFDIDEWFDEHMNPIPPKRGPIDGVVVSGPDRQELRRLRQVIGSDLASQIDWMGRGKKAVNVAGVLFYTALAGGTNYALSALFGGSWIDVVGVTAIASPFCLYAGLRVADGYRDWSSPRIERMAEQHPDIEDDIINYACPKGIV